MFGRLRSVIQAFSFLKKALPISDSTCVCKCSLSQNPLFVKGLFIIFLMFLFVYFTHVFSKSLLLFFFFFFSFLLKSCQKNVNWTENMNCQDQNVTLQDVMLGLNPSLPALERCLDCFPLYTAVCLVLFTLLMSGMLALE